MHSSKKSTVTVGTTRSTVRGKAYTRHTVTYRDIQSGERKRKFFNDRAEAERWAAQHRKDVQRHTKQTEILHNKIGERAQQLSGDILRDAVDAIEILKGEASLADVARYYMNDVQRRSKRIPTVDELAEQYILASESANLRPATIAEIKIRINRFIKSYGKARVDEVTRSDVQKWLDGMRNKRTGKALAANSQTHYRHAVGGMFNFAIERELVDENPAVHRTTSRRGKGRKNTEYQGEVFTPDEARRILKTAADSVPDMMAPLAIGLFAGIRVAEIRRLTWDKHIDLERGVVKITGDIAKLRACRNVKIEPNLNKWLEAVPVKIGQIAPHTDQQWRKRIQKIVNLSKIDQWPQNGMRHSFGTYHLEMSQDAAKTALQMGHLDGGGTLFDHYRQLTDHETAEKYWKIEPDWL